ncbi:aminotransferase class I/II-fold pyridoxal phosphate-dependent enzyme [Photorhabdus noenieputensis]|uniref:pyridoxal phosphate-dependent aminotransferase n=1 Tax=Photorhabdus noenieputensis TaxID=1208607 RepID=UPI001BD32225|nr:aminotransferase class I/II-fold pyridoxal phosphate-dependent enzyme [Photorhabdus noenieputensis]MBS9438918.1 aminotransferase class I/II-fold pyridoxal phosphate-dependent enzyme [Photorhabdus noenieputensis]MCK3671171.1 histidinol-phosphate aminotransferase family protein [Photorhabdus noenieputensis]
MFNIQAVIKEHVLENKRESLWCYLEERPNYLMLDKNENHHPMDEDLFEVFRASLKPEHLCNYPVLNNLYKKIAELVGVEERNIYLGSGSDLAIKALFDACLREGDHVVLHNPCYFMFENYAKYAGVSISSTPVTEDWKPDVAAIIDAVKENTKLVVVEDPSGFVGTRLSYSQMHGLAEALYNKGVLLLIDEAYLYVEGKQSANLNILQKFPNVILAQTLSKAHGLAGARVGFLIGETELIGHISNVRPLYEISALSAWAAEWQLDHPEVLERFQEKMRQTKAYMREALTERRQTFKDTHGNFMLVQFAGYDSKEIEQLFQEQGILIRRPFEQSNLRGWLRVTISQLEHCEKFISALDIVVDKLNLKKI